MTFDVYASTASPGEFTPHPLILLLLHGVTDPPEFYLFFTTTPLPWNGSCLTILCLKVTALRKEAQGLPLDAILIRKQAEVYSIMDVIGSKQDFVRPATQRKPLISSMSDIY